MKSIKRRGFLKLTAGLLSALPAAADDSKGAAVQRRPVFSAFDTAALEACKQAGKGLTKFCY